jgi:ATP-dependent Clp protease ATP-binding subunit ClpC
MFEQYSEHARSVMERARQEAQKFGHDHLGTEHILLGLLEVKEGCAACVLKHRNVNLAGAKEQVQNLVKQGSVSRDGAYQSLPCTPHAQHVLNDAVKEARMLKHPTIGTEHLLLGLLYEKECIATEVLGNLGLKLDEVRNDVLYFLNCDSCPIQTD